jgi:hypothetical protein
MSPPIVNGTFNQGKKPEVNHRAKILMVRHKLPGQVSPDYPLVFSLPILHILLNEVQSKMKQFHES